MTISQSLRSRSLGAPETPGVVGAVLRDRGRGSFGRVDEGSRLTGSPETGSPGDGSRVRYTVPESSMEGSLLGGSLD